MKRAVPVEERVLWILDWFDKHRGCTFGLPVTTPRRLVCMRDNCTAAAVLVLPRRSAIRRAIGAAGGKKPLTEQDCQCNPRCALGCVPGCPACKQPKRPARARRGKP